MRNSSAGSVDSLLLVVLLDLAWVHARACGLELWAGAGSGLLRGLELVQGGELSIGKMRDGQNYG